LHRNKNTLFIGKVRSHFPKLASTNSFAINSISKNNPIEGSVISTDNQTDGKGQIGSLWESEPNMNLTLSLILYPRFILAKNQFLLNQAICLAVRDFVADITGLSAKVKWSNDIYINDKKVSGILIQNSLSGSNIQSCVAGMGININQTVFLSDAPNPTSFALETSQIYNLKEIENSLFAHLEFRYLQLKNGQYEILQKDYINHLYRYAEEHLFQIPDGPIFSGKITGISPQGKLMIAHSKGEDAYNFKEVKFVI